jgi:hypothetical protein
MKSSKKSSIGRRKLLKRVSAVTAAVSSVPGITSVAGASSTDKSIIVKAMKLKRKNNWEADEWHNYLQGHDIPVESGYRTETVQVPHPKKESEIIESGEMVEPQKFDRHDVHLEFGYSKVPEGSYANCFLNWTHHNGDLDDFGEAPPDIGTIGFSSDHYNRTYDVDWVTYGSYCRDPPGFDSKNPNHGVAAAWGDGAYLSGGRGGFTIYIEPKSGTTRRQREFEFDYVHTWTGTGLNGITFGSGGVGLSFTSNTSRWDVERSYTEEQLISVPEYSP